MKKILATIAVFYLAVGLVVAQSFPKDGKIYAHGYGDRTSGTINGLLTRIGSANATMVCGSGQWSITNDVTFPANVTLEVPYGSTIDIDTTVVFTVNGPFDAGVYSVFTGNGTAAGSAEFPYRYTQWGDTNQYNIGTGQISIANSSISTILNASSNALGENLLNLGSVQAVTGSFDVANITNANIAYLNGDVNFTGDWLNLSNDMAVSFMGFPKVTLTTNMVSSTIGSGSGVVLDSFTNAFDLDTSTSTTTGDIAAGASTHDYSIDLGTNYQGVLRVKLAMTGNAGAGHGISGWVESGMTDQGVYQSYYGGSGDNQGIFEVEGDTTANEQYAVIPMEARVIDLSFLTTSLGGASTLWFLDISFYGVTNAYRNMGDF